MILCSRSNRSLRLDFHSSNFCRRVFSNNEVFISNQSDALQVTNRDGVVSGLGGFGALFDLSKTRFKDKNPILVSGTDGVGTKLRVAMSYNKVMT